MDVGGMTLLLAIATFTLAIVAIVSILQTKRFNATLVKKAQLKEILEWAINIGTYMLSRNLPPFEKHCIDGDNEYLDDATVDITISEFTKFRLQSVYINEVSKGVLEIQGLVNDAVKHLRGKIRLLNKYEQQYNKICNTRNKRGILKAALNIARNEDRLYDSIVDIIKKLGNINSLN